MSALYIVVALGLCALGSLCAVLSVEFQHPDEGTDALRLVVVSAVCWLGVGALAVAAVMNA